MRRICAACRETLYPGQTTGESSLYSPSRAFILCESCWEAEDAMIEERGTNNLPDILERYRANLSLPSPIAAGRMGNE